MVVEGKLSNTIFFIMKLIKNHRFLIMSFCLLVSATGFLGCEREKVEPAENQVPVLQQGKYRHVIALQDGPNTATLAISSDNAEALAEFEANVRMKALTADAAGAEAPQMTSEPVTMPLLTDENAVHISVLSSELEATMEGIELSLEDANATGKTDLYGTYSGGPYYFYSWAAPHYFKVTPLGRCVSAWLQQAGSSWTYCSWAGGSGGNYLCNYAWAASSSVNSLDYRLRAQGQNFSVYWY
jgi:hypothetical protein